jgi:hypothetical protein
MLYSVSTTKLKVVRWNVPKDEYLAERKPELRPRTHQDYACYLARGFRYGVTKLADITLYDLAESVAKLNHTPLTQRYTPSVRSAPFMRWARGKHYLNRNPMERM